jgi:hypothetical protein
MQIFSLGKVAVATAGTPVALSSLLPANFPSNGSCARIIVSQVMGTTGKPCFGTTAVVASTLAGTIKQFAPAATSGLTDTYVHDPGAEGGNPLNVNNYAIDVTVNGEGLIVSIEVR